MPQARVSPQSLRQLRLGPVALSEKRWKQMFPRLVAFHREFGHCDVPEGWPENRQLATWVGAVRGRARHKRLRPEYRRALEQLDFTFEPRSSEWDTLRKALVSFRERYGHTAVPRWWKALPELGIWVSNVRTRYHRRLRPGRNVRTLSDEKVRQMEELGFLWHPKEEFVRIAFAGLTAFKARHGHAEVPRDFPDTQLLRSLGRVKKDHRRGKLPADIARQFERLGFPLTKPRPRSAWDARFEALRDFKKRQGRVDVHKNEDEGLAMWLIHQRTAMRRGALESAKRQRLEALGVRVERAEDVRFQRRLAEWKDFQARRGRRRVRAHGKDRPALARWCATLRAMKREGRLRPERVCELLASGFEFEPHADDWARRFSELKAFKARFGHTNVPRYWKENRALGPWVSNQRQDRRRGELSRERLRLLEGLGFTWELNDERWEAMYRRLEAFHDVHGHAAGPFTERKLSSWAGQQRLRRRLGRLSRKRIRRLDALHFAWTSVARWTLEPYLELAREFRRRHHHLSIPNKAPHASLFRWAEIQRGNYRRQRLEPKLRRELDAIGFPLTARDAQWERHFAAFLERPRRTGEHGEVGRWLASQRRLVGAGELELDKEERLKRAGAL
jgi:hypothetical protein